MRIPGEEPRLIPERAIPLEKDLHDVLTEHPELIPAEDLQLGRLVVVGRESALASGYADLVCIDQDGDVCLVEVKKEGNPGDASLHNCSITRAPSGEGRFTTSNVTSCTRI